MRWLSSPIPRLPLMSRFFTCRTKTDGFKHLQRLQSLVPSYVATLAEAIRRRLFSTHLKTSSTSLAEFLGKLSAEEKKRRGRYQAEYAGKLPWEAVGLEESVPNVEVDVRSSRDATMVPQQIQKRASPIPAGAAEATLDDLLELEASLTQIDTNLRVDDLPPRGLPHPVRDALAVLVKQKRQILTLQEDFDRLNAKLENSSSTTPGPSAVTSINMSNSTSGEQLRALEEKCQNLERDLQAERSAREEQVSEFAVKNAELQQAKVALEQDTQAAKVDRDRIASKLKDALLAVANAETAATQLRKEKEAHVLQAGEAACRIEHMRRDLRSAQQERNELEDNLSDVRGRHDKLTEEKAELLELVAEKERLLRDTKSEAELDRAMLERELTEEKQRSARASADIAGKLSAAEEQLDEVKSGRDGEMAELQVMCNERGRALEDAKREKVAMQASVRTLLNLFRLFFDAYTSHLKAFIDEPIPAVIAASSSPSKENSSHSSPASYDVPIFDAKSLEAATASLKSFDSSLMELARRKMDECALQTKKWMKECKRYRERAARAVDAAKEKLAFRRCVWQNRIALPKPAAND